MAAFAQNVGKLDDFVIDADNPLVRSYEAWRGGVASSALFLQSYLSPAVDTFLKPGGGIFPQVTPGSAGLTLSYGLSVLAFVVSAGLIYSIYVQGAMWLYKNKLWYRFNKKFAIMGYWDAGFIFQKSGKLAQKVTPTGYILVEQDYLGRAEVSGFYNWNPSLNRYLSEFTMSGTCYVDGARPAFRFFFETNHFGDSEFAPIADTSEGIEIVGCSGVSPKNGYPTRLMGIFAIYKRSREKSMWSGQTIYSRNSDLTINHVQTSE